MRGGGGCSGRVVAWGCLTLVLVSVVMFGMLSPVMIYRAAGWFPAESAPIRLLAGIRAYRVLGLDGAACLTQRETSYDPAEAGPDPTLVAERPEHAVAARLAGHDYTVERVIVSHRAPHADVWVLIRGTDGREHRHVLTLIAEDADPVALRLPRHREVICYVHAGQWRIIQDRPVDVV